MQNQYIYILHINVNIFNIFVEFQDKKLKQDEACATGQQFTQLYYEFVDKKRNVSLSDCFPFLVMLQ